MAINIGLPKEYEQITELEICSNKLIDSQSLIGINDFSPFLIGKGIMPKVWLYFKDPSNSWQLLIRNNQSLHPLIKIESQDVSTKIIINNEIILDAKMTGPNSCFVSKIDLRPVGLNIYGNNEGLSVGETKLKGNTFKSTKYIIGMNE